MSLYGEDRMIKIAEENPHIIAASKWRKDSIQKIEKCALEKLQTQCALEDTRVEALLITQDLSWNADFDTVAREKFREKCAFYLRIPSESFHAHINLNGYSEFYEYYQELEWDVLELGLSKTNHSHIKEKIARFRSPKHLGVNLYHYGLLVDILAISMVSEFIESNNALEVFSPCSASDLCFLKDVLPILKFVKMEAPADDLELMGKFLRKIIALQIQGAEKASLLSMRTL